MTGISQPGRGSPAHGPPPDPFDRALDELREHADTDAGWTGSVREACSPPLDDAAGVGGDGVPPDGALAREDASGIAPTVSELELQALLARVVHQDEQALARIYAALVGRVYGLALRILRHAPTAEEVCEDAFWQVWRQAPRFDPDRGTAVAWILTIARSRALDAVRVRQRALADTVSIDDIAEVADASDGPAGGMGEDPQDLLSAAQGDRRLHTALLRLEPMPRQLIALAFFRGLTHDEIAEHMGVPLGTVKSHIRRGLIALRGWLDPDADPAGPPMPATDV